MKPAAFFRTDPVRRVLERASQAASMPVSVHFIDQERVRPALAGTGRCEACRYVSEHPDGPDACLKSRLPASNQACVTNKPAPFLCHMGFACVSTPAFTGDTFGIVVTLGPYCPSEAPETLADDALRGLKAIEKKDRPFFPVPLSDIALVSAVAAPAIAEWTTEALTELWKRTIEQDDANEMEPETSATPRGRATRRAKGKTPDTSPYRGADIAAALAGGNQPQARALVRSAIAEVSNQGEVLAVRRARTIALTGAALEAAERAGLETTESWEEFPAFLSSVRQSRTDSELVDGAMAMLAIILRRTVRASTDGALAELNRIVMERLPEPIQLNDVAQRLGKHPTAITHQLQRKFGLSYTQYLGRLRIDMAKDLLRRTRLSVRDVAQRVGIADSSNFSKMFRKFEGISPQQYRTQYRNKR
jgi:AraC-like DNA-binding protein